MKLRLLAALLGAVALPCLALAAPPAVPTGNLALKDANLANQSEIVIPMPGYTGSGAAPFYLGHALFGENSITGGFQPGVMDGTDYGLWTHTVNGATATGQATTNSLLGQLAGAVNGTNINVTCTSGCSGSSSGGSVTVTSSALPTGAATAAGQTSIVNALTPAGGLPTAPSNAAQAHTDAIAPQSAAGTSAATAVTVQGSANGVPIPTKEINSAAIAANTAFPGLGVTQLVPTTGTNTAPVALGTMPAGARAVRLYPETATGASVTIAWTRAASATAAASQFAAGAYNTVSLSSTGPNWDESLSGGLNLYIGAVSGAATFAYQ